MEIARLFSAMEKNKTKQNKTKKQHKKGRLLPSHEEDLLTYQI